MVLPQDPLNMIICGVGGQGNILISQLLARALTKKGFIVTRGETFGAAQRSGAVMSSIRISSKETYGPLIPSGKADIVLGLEPLEALRILKKYGNPVVKCITNTHPNFPIGSILSEKSKYPDQNELRQAIKSLSKKAWFIDAAAIASKLGAPIVTNIVMMGALLGTGLLEIERKDIEDEMKAAFPPDKLALNLKALDAGISAIR